jgi:hypothetical protein
MILTEIFVVICTLTGGHCSNYIDVTSGILSPSACETAIQQVVRDHAAPGAILNRERSSCSRRFVNTQKDMDS